MLCVSPVRLLKNVDFTKYPDGLLVPCGKCINCRIMKRKENAMRCLHELIDHEYSIFVTLTYTEENLPDYGSLKKTHLQKFLKRVRKQLSLYDRKIRYFACGEYGDKTQRPHYHLIIFGMSLDEFDKSIIRDSWPYCDWRALERWPDSNPWGVAEHDSIRYVAQYIDKKLTGELADAEYTLMGREPVFKLQSLGIGRGYIQRNSDRLKENKCITVRGVKHAIPRYYLKKLGIPADELYSDYAQKADIQEVERITGQTKSDFEFYKSASVEEIRSYNDHRERRRIQSGKNSLAVIQLKQKKL